MCEFQVCAKVSNPCNDTTFFLVSQNASEWTAVCVEPVNVDCCGPCIVSSTVTRAAAIATSAVAATVSTLSSASAASFTASQTAVVGLLRCSWPEVRAFAEPMSWLLSPIGTWVPQPSVFPSITVWSVAGNAILFAVVFILHGIAAAIFGPRVVLFPALTLSCVMILSQGNAYYATRILAQCTTGSCGFGEVLAVIVGYGMIVVIVVPVLILNIRWTYVISRSLPWDGQSTFLRWTVIPVDYWTPVSTVRCWGAVFFMYRSNFQWFHIPLVLSNASVGVVVGASTTNAKCIAQLWMIVGCMALQCVVLLTCRPFRVRMMTYSLAVLTSVHAAVLVTMLWNSGSNGFAGPASAAGKVLHALEVAGNVSFALYCVIVFVVERVFVNKRIQDTERDIVLNTMKSDATVEGVDEGSYMILTVEKDGNVSSR